MRSEEASLEGFREGVPCPLHGSGVNAVRLPMSHDMVRLKAVHHWHIESGVRVTAVHRHFGMVALIIVVLQSAPAIGGDGE